ncbi:MAG: hypothetical protein AABZ39_03390 [Spirochaetota bacterium]
MQAAAERTSMFTITESERVYLRDLAKKYRDYAALPVMAEREKRWYAHNSLSAGSPMIVMEVGSFAADFLPALRCESPEAARIERKLIEPILNHELIDDDKVISPWLAIDEADISFKEFDLNISRSRVKDARGLELGYHDESPITDLIRDFHILKPSVFSVNREMAAQRMAFAEDVLGDILPLRRTNRILDWYLGISAKCIRLMGMERYCMALIDTPDAVRDLYRFLRDDARRFIRWLEYEGLLTLNNGNQYAGAGSYGFTDELPKDDVSAGVKLSDLWVNMNSQETISVSPSMYADLIFPTYRELAAECGLVYYGCCEPVHTIWDDCLSKLPNLRKVSISAWCNENFMGERLRGSRIIYSRKPDPTLIGVGAFDEARYREHMAKTLTAAKGGTLEVVFRDVYSISGEKSRPGKAVRILRELIEKHWR